jgi:hypothetical protein
LLNIGGQPSAEEFPDGEVDESGLFVSRPSRLPVSSAVSFSPQITSVGTLISSGGKAGGVTCSPGAGGPIFDAR